MDLAWLMPTLAALGGVLLVTFLFFFATTRGALIVRSWMPGVKAPDAHVYPIYSRMGLIRLIDFQPIIAAILLFQYDRLVRIMTHVMSKMDLRGKKALITSCAFGNVMPCVTRAALRAGADKVQVVDIIENELINAESKLREYRPSLEFFRGDAAHVGLPQGSVDVNVIFFLLHELPNELKNVVLEEACRVLAPGGKLFLGEFHRPHSLLMRMLSWTYFKVFEPWGLALWDTHDPMEVLSAIPGMQCERRLAFFGNYQMIIATKQT